MDKENMIVIKFGNDNEDKNPEPKQMSYDKESSKKEENKYTMTDYGGYSPTMLRDKLEDSRNAISKGNIKEAMSLLDNCIIRLSGKIPENEKENELSSFDYAFNKLGIN